MRRVLLNEVWLNYPIISVLRIHSWMRCFSSWSPASPSPASSRLHFRASSLGCDSLAAPHTSTIKAKQQRCSTDGWFSSVKSKCITRLISNHLEKFAWTVREDSECFQLVYQEGWRLYDPEHECFQGGTRRVGRWLFQDHDYFRKVSGGISYSLSDKIR